jgi:hypothetical protein
VKRDSTRLDTSLTVNGLENNTKYYWRVRGKNAAGFGEWSIAWSITTIAVGIVTPESMTGDRLLSQNFPNPFEFSTIIRYRVPFKDHVVLKVYDTSGRICKTLIDEIMTPGSYEITFDPANILPGVLFYEIRTGSGVQKRKMMLVK